MDTIILRGSGSGYGDGDGYGYGYGSGSGYGYCYGSGYGYGYIAVRGYCSRLSKGRMSVYSQHSPLMELDSNKL